jgi:hypothetical protein
MPDDMPPELVEAFRRLGVRNPEGWARSQTREGINQMGRACLLYWLFYYLVGQHDLGWVDREIALYDQFEAKRPGRGAARLPHGPVLKRLLAAGATREELTVLCREMQLKTLYDCCAVLDCIRVPPDEVAIDCFGVFEVDADGNPLRRVPGLHESIGEFDREYQVRRATLEPRRGDGAS